MMPLSRALNEGIGEETAGAKAPREERTWTGGRHQEEASLAASWVCLL